MGSNFKKLVRARMAETGEGWQAASRAVRNRVKSDIRPVSVQELAARPDTTTPPGSGKETRDAKR